MPPALDDKVDARKESASPKTLRQVCRNLLQHRLLHPTSLLVLRLRIQQQPFQGNDLQNVLRNLMFDVWYWYVPNILLNKSRNITRPRPQMRFAGMSKVSQYRCFLPQPSSMSSLSCSCPTRPRSLHNVICFVFSSLFSAFRRRGQQNALLDGSDYWLDKIQEMQNMTTG